MIYEHINDGTLTLIEPEGLKIMKEIVNDFKPEIVVEFGTYKGGMVKYFINWLPNSHIFTTDAFWLINEQDAGLFREKKVTVIIQNLFNDNILVPMLLSLPLKKMLFCDNGHREMEIRNFAGYLRPGDLLVTHDWPTECKNINTLTFDNFVSLDVNTMLDETPGISDLRFWKRKAYFGPAWEPDKGKR
jgi:hypothetical protein